MKELVVGLLGGSLIGTTQAKPSISALSHNRLSPNGGFRLTVTGSGFLATDFNPTSQESVPTALIKRGDYEIPCQVITHLLSDESLTCEMDTIPLPPSIFGSNDWKIKIVNDQGSATKGDFKFKTSDGPEITKFEQNPQLTPSATSGSWSSWINNDTPSGTGNSEYETLEAFVTGGGCNNPLMIQARNVASGIVYDHEALLTGFNECECVGDIFKGLSCEVPETEIGKFFCTEDHEVRYYCSDANVIGAHINFRDDNEMIHQPALYDSSGAKFATCDTTFINDAGELITTGGNYWGDEDYMRCQLSWSRDPTVGNFNLKTGHANGYAVSKKNVFLGSDGNLYNMQVRPRIDSVSPQVGATVGGTTVTVTGEYLTDATDIRVGGVKCTNVQAAADGLSATCVTGGSPAGCNGGDTPDAGVNCANYQGRSLLDSHFAESSLYTRDGTGAHCVTGCSSNGNPDGANMGEPKCENVFGDNTRCYVPNCERYVRKYPGSPGLDYTYANHVGDEWLDHPQYNINNFGVSLPNANAAADTGSDIISSTYASKGMRMNTESTDQYSAEIRGFWKPPVDGYYSMTVLQCDDICRIQIAEVGDAGCPADLVTRGYNDEHQSGLLKRDTQIGTYSTQEKIFLSADSQYQVIFHHSEGGGGDYSEFGFIYHGENADENMVHGPFQKADVENMGELLYSHEEVRLQINNEGSDELQDITVDVTDDESEFTLLLCPRDGDDTGCAETTPLNFNMNDDDFESALEEALYAQCLTKGYIDTDKGFFNDASRDKSMGSGSFRSRDHGSLCGIDRSYGMPKGGRFQLYNLWYDESWNPNRGEGFKVKNNKFACFGLKGSIDHVTLYAEKEDDGGTLRGWWFTQSHDAVSPNSWNHFCIDLRPLLEAEMADRPEWFANPEDHNTNDFVIKHLQLGDSQARSANFFDELAIGNKNNAYNIIQTSAAVAPGRAVREFVVNSVKGGDFTFNVQMKGTNAGCGGDSFTMIRVGGGATGTVTRTTAMGAGISGSLGVNYKDMTAMINTDWILDKNDQAIKNELISQFGNDFGDIDLEMSGNCNSALYLNIIQNQGGDYADLTVNADNLNGDAVSAITRQYRHGGVIFRTITDAQMSRAFDAPQVQVWSGDVQAVCAGDCSFSFDDAGVPSITDVTPITVSGNDQFVITGTNLDNAQGVMVGDASATIVSSDSTSATVSCEACVAGTHDVVFMNDIGKSNAISVDFTAAVSSVNPTTVNAGDTVTVSGFSFPADVSVAIGGSSCVTQSATSTEVVCTVTGAAGTHDVTVDGVSSGVNVDVSNDGPTCTISGSYSPAFLGSVSYDCGADVENAQVFIDGHAVSATGSTFEKPMLTSGTYDVAIFGDGVASLATLDVSYSVTGVGGKTGGRLGMGIINVSGDNLDGAVVTVGGQECEVASAPGANYRCHAPPLASAVVDMNVDGASVLTGAFAGGDVTVEAGSRINFNWNIFLADQTTPVFSINVGDVTLSTQEGNRGSQWIVLTEEGTYDVSSGAYDGVNFILGKINVVASTGDQTADIVIMMGDEVARTATYTYTFDDVLTFGADDVTVDGSSVTVTGASGKIYAGDSSCTTVAGSCDIDVAGGSYNLKVDNMVAANSDADDVSFDVTVTGIASSTNPVSSFGGAKVLLAGNNLAGVTFVLVGGCLAEHSYEAPNLAVTLPTTIGCLQIAGESNVEFNLDGVTFTTDLNTAATGFGDFTLAGAANGNELSFTSSGTGLSGTVTPIAAFNDISGATITGTCAPVDASAGVTCAFDTGASMAGPLNYWVGYEDFGLVSSFSGVFMTPSIDSISAIEGSHFGGHVVTITGADMDKSIAVSHVIDGVDVCASGCSENLVDGNTLTYVTPASGFDAGTVTATVSVSANGLTSGTVNYDYKGALTPNIDSVTRSGSDLRIDMVKGVNADCNKMIVTIDGVECPLNDCSAIKKSRFISCDFPAVEAGDKVVLVTDPDTGNSNTLTTISVTLSFDSIQPTSSGLAGGAPLTIIGEGMSLSSTVTLCGESCPLSDRSTPNALICALPVRPTTETCDVTVDDGNRKRRSTTNVGPFNFDDSLTASVDAVATSNGKIRGGTAGGTLVTLTGTGFNDGSGNTVTIHGSECVTESETTTEIVCRTSAHTGSGYYDIEVDVSGVGLFVAPTQFRYVNAWSSPATWGCSSGTLAECDGAPNERGDLVEIGPGNDILFDISTPVLSVLIIRGGSLIWDIDQDELELSAEYVVIVDGHFEIGTEDEPMMNQATITIYGHHRSIHLPIYGAKCFAVRSGTVDIHGAPVVPTWTFLEETAEAGDSSIVIQTPDGLTNWKVGDRMAIAPTGGANSIVESEDRVITSIVDNTDGTHTIGLDEPLNHMHTGVETQWEGFDGQFTLNQRAEIGLLSRNIKFQGSQNPAPWYQEIPSCDNFDELDLGLESVQNCFVDRFGNEEGSDKFGAHMLFHSVTYAKVEYMEIHHAGQASELGRYPIHFHNSYDQPDSYLRGLGIWQTFNRAMTLHAVNNCLFENNVAYNNMGHAYFMEDGVETGNVVRYNLAIMTKISSSLLSVDQTPTSFWIVNANNEYYGNHAAGAAGFGFWLNPPKRSTGSNVRDDYCPREIPVKRFSENTAHSNGVYGMWIFEDYTPRKNNWDGTCRSDAGMAGADHPLESLTAWGNLRGCEMSMGDGVHMKGFVAADNEISGLALKENHRTDNYEVDSTTYVDSVVIGHSDSHPTRTSCHAFGIETPWKFGSAIFSGVKFYNYDTDHEDCYGIDYCYGSYPFDCGRISHWDRITWTNSPRKGKFDWEFETVLWDIDGSLSETGQANSKITPKSELYNEHCSDYTNGFDIGFPAMHCNDQAHFHRVSVENISPGSLNSVNIIAQNMGGANEARVPWREKRGDAGRAWMFLNLQDDNTELHFDTFYNMPNVSFSLKTNYDNPGHYSNLWFDLIDQPDLVEGLGNELSQMPALEDENYGWFIDESSGGDIWIHLGAEDGEVWGTMEQRSFETKKCWFPNCIVPDTGNPNPPAAEDIVQCNWSDASCWPGGEVPLDGANVTIVIDRHVIIDVDNLVVDDLYVEGTLELDQSACNPTCTIEANNILVNTGKGGVNDFDTTETLLAAAADNARSFWSDDSLPHWQFGRLIIGTEDEPIACNKQVNIKMTAVDAQAREGWGAMDNSVPVGNKTLASFGRLSLVGCGSATNYVVLKKDAAVGDSSITVKSSANIADWSAGMQVVLSPSGPRELETETLTIASINGDEVTFTTPLVYAHAGQADNKIDALGAVDHYSVGSEMGLLTRNIKIDGSLDGTEKFYGGRVLVASAPNNKIYRQGHATISNVEFFGMGQYGMTDLRDPRFALAFYGIEDANGMTGTTDTHEVSGNEYQPAGYEIGASYVRDCSFHNNFGVAIGANKANNIDISNNVVANAVDDGIKVGYSNDVTINSNMVSGVIDNVFMMVPSDSDDPDSPLTPLWRTQHNFDFDGIFMPTGISTIEESTVASMKNNVVAGIQGPAYSTWGEVCDASEVNTSNAVSTVSKNNVGRSSVYGLRNLWSSVSLECVRYGGFSFAYMSSFGFGSILSAQHVIWEDISVQNSPVGAYLNDFGVMAVSHVSEDKTRTVKDSIFIAHGGDGDCNRDYFFNTQETNEGAMMEMWKSHHIERQFMEKMTDLQVGWVWSNMQGGMHPFPHKGFDKQNKNMVLTTRDYLNKVKFVNYGVPCTGTNAPTSHAVVNNPKMPDHHQQTDVSNIKWYPSNTDDNSKFFLHEPQLKWINPSDCVDMDCDGPKKAMLLDSDGSFNGGNTKTTWMGVSDLDYGINGPRGLGNFRIPAVMLVNLDGSNVQDTFANGVDDYVVNKGVYGTHSSACTHNTEGHFYKCDSTIDYAQVMYESMDVDTETRRVAPIAIINNADKSSSNADSYVDIVNGVLDTSCCAGYACQLRQTTHPLIMACGQEYEFATTGTLNKDFKLHMNRQDPNCQILLKIYTKRQNRQDVFIDGNLIPASNSVLEADGSLTFSNPDSSHIPQVGDGVGVNFFDRTEQMLFVNVQGNSVVRVIVAKTLVVEFQSTNTELTADELYDSENLRFYLASILGIDISKIKVVNVVAENGSSRRKRRSDQGLITHGVRSKRNAVANTIVLEIDNSDEPITSEDTTINNNNEAVLEQNTKFAETIIAATLNNEIPADLELIPQVAVQTVTPPSVPECLADEIEQNSNVDNALDPDYVPGASCSIVTFYNTTPEALDDFVDTQLLTPIAISGQDEEDELAANEAVQSFKAPSDWSIAVQPASIDENLPMTPPLRLNLLDDQNTKIEATGFLNATYEATITILSGGLSFSPASTTVVQFNSDGQAVFDDVAFTGSGDVTLQIALTSPSNTGLAPFTVGPYTVKNAPVVDPDQPELACDITSDKIKCVANNMASSTSLLMSTLESMTNEELLAVKWLIIDQNTGIDSDALVPVMAKLLNLERLSLNSNGLWTLHPDTFNLNTKLASISLHNNALQCLDGVFDNLIEKDILQRIRLTQNVILNSDWSSEYRYRGAEEMQQFKDLIDANLCNA